MKTFLFNLLKFLLLIITILICVAYFTLLERKILSTIQRRKGPNVVGSFGLLQPLADGLKLLLKEIIIPSNADVFWFVFAPIFTFFMSLIGWAVIPFANAAFYTEINASILYLLAVSSLSVYGIIIAGWSSNSKYAFLGALRSAAQMISYELTISLIILCITIGSDSLNLGEVVECQRDGWFIFPFFPLFPIFFACCLAETNRHPFDLPEAEAELVSGYNVEYSSIGFALFFLGEYSNMLLMSSVCTILFFGGWFPPFKFYCLTPGFWFSLKVCICIFFIIIARAILPRYRYDQLMTLGWKVFIPFTLSYFILMVCYLVAFGFL